MTGRRCLNENLTIYIIIRTIRADIITIPIGKHRGREEPQMVRIVSESTAHASIIMLERGSVFYCAGIVPDEIGHLAKMEHIASGEMRLVAKTDLVVVVDGLWRQCTGANHILFLRADRAGEEGAGSLWVAKPKQCPRLRDALIAANVPHVESIGGFDHMLVYNDELAISESLGGLGSYGWIVKRSDVERYMKMDRERIEPRRMGRLTIWHEIHWDHNGDKFSIVRVEGWSEPPIKDDVTVYSKTEYTILFDEKTRIVQQILLTNGDVENIPCDRAPLRRVVIGRKLPGNLAIGRR